MQRVVLSALTLCAAMAQASAQPYPQPYEMDGRRIYAAPQSAFAPRGYERPRGAYRPPIDPDERIYAEPHRLAPARVYAHPQREIAAHPRDGELGGGFIEMLFGGDRPAAPRAVAVPAARQASLGRAAHLREIDPIYLKQTVDYYGPEKPGTVIVDTQQRFLFLVQANGTALRYGIGVGRPGFTWAGIKTITAKKEWPDWTPPKEMLQRRPDLPTFMAGGADNPLGARALYLGSSLYRIHGSNEPWTIGQAVSSGCIRMRNEDVVDLYERVGVGTKVRVI